MCVGCIGLAALIDLVHFMFYLPRCDDDDDDGGHAPPSPSARVAYHFSPVLPALPRMTSACPRSSSSPSSTSLSGIQSFWMTSLHSLRDSPLYRLL